MADLNDTLTIEQLLEKIRLDTPFEEGKIINKKRLINALNYLNFKEENILINFKHAKYGNIISIPVSPQPCSGDILECVWINDKAIVQKLKSYEFQSIILSDGRAMILVKPQLTRFDEGCIRFNLPDTCYEIHLRKVKRHPCEGISVELIQNGIVFYGELIDFSAVSFNVKVFITPPQSFQWINSDNAVNIIFKNEQGVLFSGECKITKQISGHNMRTLILAPLNNNIVRFKPKNFRSTRQKLMPSPSIIFRHPIIGRFINLAVEDISGAGVSTEEYFENSVLLPGMIIPDLAVEFASGFNINCRAQVVYRNTHETNDEKTIVKCGIAILDMDIQDQVKISSLLHKMTNEKSYVCNSVDMDSLWKFFFEAGFVYPKKYALMHAKKAKFKETYEKLYVQSPHIARHFVYQDKGIIQGHISMLRAYEKTWLFHHHASSSNAGRAGLVVLDQIGRYVNDFYCLYSTHMNFIICYFRPENRFPNRVFGGCAREIANPKGCSIDAFAYLLFPRNFESWDLPGVLITKARAEDIRELGICYEHESGGLALNALDLEPDLIDCDNLSKDYEKIGFKRERHVFSLTMDGCVKAIIMLNISGIGLNLSNLTNCINVFVMDEDLPRNVLISAISNLSKYYAQDEVPVLLHPVSYADKQFIPYEKIYNLWVLNIHKSGEEYLKYIDKLVAQIRQV